MARKAKSLTEAAKEVLKGQSLNEGIPSIGPLSGGVSNPNPVDSSATLSTSNAKTLHPHTKFGETRHAQDGAGAPGPEKFPQAEDLGGATPTSTAKENLGAKAAGHNKKDKSVKGAGNNTEPGKHLEEDGDTEGQVVEFSLADRLKALKEARKEKKEDKDDHKEPDGDEKCMKEEEEIEISEELEQFIAQAIEEGLTEEEILQAIDENFEIIEEEVEAIEEENNEPVVTSGLSAENYQVDMSEHVNALLEGEALSEEFKAKATTIFEAAVKAKLEEEVALLEQAYTETLEERIAQIEEELSTQIDNYLNYVVEQWIEENEVAVESALRSELTEDFISGLRALFAEHYIDVPEEEVNVVEELAQTVEELESKLNEQIQRNVELTSVLEEARKYEITNSVCEGLTATQAEKLKSLVENVAYTSDEEFVEKVETLKENYFPTAAKNDSVLDRAESQDPKMISESALDGPMAKYVQAIGKTSKK